MIFSQHYTDNYIVERAKALIRKKLHVQVDSACIIGRSADCVTVKVLHANSDNSVISLGELDLKQTEMERIG